MRYATPGATFTVRFDGFPTGLAGVFGAQILDADDAVVTARATTGIVESPAGSGSYLVTRTAPAVAGDYTVFADSGAITPGTTAGEQLQVTYTPLSPAPTDAFATADDLAARLGLTLTDAEQARATTLLDLATGLIQDEAKQTILLVTDDVLSIPGTTDEMIKLPQRPVISVASVTLDGVPLTEGSDWYRDGNVIARIPAITTVLTGGLIDEAFTFPMGTGFGWPAQTLEITYTHGYAVVPESVKAICLEMVVRVWVNPGSVARETVGNTATVYDNMRFSPAGLLLTAAEQRVIRRMFGRSAKSITIGR